MFYCAVLCCAVPESKLVEDKIRGGRKLFGMKDAPSASLLSNKYFFPLKDAQVKVSQKSLCGILSSCACFSVLVCVSVCVCVCNAQLL